MDVTEKLLRFLNTHLQHLNDFAEQNPSAVFRSLLSTRDYQLYAYQEDKAAPEKYKISFSIPYTNESAEQTNERYNFIAGKFDEALKQKLGSHFFPQHPKDGFKKSVYKELKIELEANGFQQTDHFLKVEKYLKPLLSNVGHKFEISKTAQRGGLSIIEKANTEIISRKLIYFDQGNIDHSRDISHVIYKQLQDKYSEKPSIVFKEARTAKASATEEWNAYLKELEARPDVKIKEKELISRSGLKRTINWPEKPFHQESNFGTRKENFMKLLREVGNFIDEHEYFKNRLHYGIVNNGGSTLLVCDSKDLSVHELLKTSHPMVDAKGVIDQSSKFYNVHSIFLPLKKVQYEGMFTSKKAFIDNVEAKSKAPLPMVTTSKEIQKNVDNHSHEK